MAIRLPENYLLKPEQPYKKVITPSSLYKGNCARCTWMSYWHNFSIPANLALQQLMSRIQEDAFDGVDNHEISTSLPKGWASLYKGKFSSRPITINGETTRWKFYGALDILTNNEDGTHSIIDGKVSMKKDEAGLIASYWTQLEAYVYMLEKPELGEPKSISSIGLLQWRIDGSLEKISTAKGFSVEQRYIPVERNEAKFHTFMEKFIGVIEGAFPASSSDCLDCKFLREINFYSE
jgi:PD-(D/E)XK nuclease superfamily